MPEPTRPYIVDLIESLQRMGDRVVVRRDRVDTTAANLLGAVHRYARALDERGIGRGDLVAVYAPSGTAPPRPTAQGTRSTRSDRSRQGTGTIDLQRGTGRGTK